MGLAPHWTVQLIPASWTARGSVQLLSQLTSSLWIDKTDICCGDTGLASVACPMVMRAFASDSRVAVTVVRVDRLGAMLLAPLYRAVAMLWLQEANGVGAGNTQKQSG